MFLVVFFAIHENGVVKILANIFHILKFTANKLILSLFKFLLLICSSYPYHQNDRSCPSVSVDHNLEVLVEALTRSSTYITDKEIGTESCFYYYYFFLGLGLSVL